MLLNAPELLPPNGLENPPRLTTWLKAVSLTTKSVLDDATARSSWQSWSLLAAMAPLAAGNEALRRVWPSSSPAAYDPDDEDFDLTSRILELRISDFSRAAINRSSGARSPSGGGGTIGVWPSGWMGSAPAG